MKLAESLTSRRALLRLTERRPNEVVTLADICAELGHGITQGALHNVASSLKRDLPIEGVPGHGGGYVKLVPVPTLGPNRCAGCRHRTPLSWCPRTRREVGLNCWCWGYEVTP
jgi:hypothetical protein